MTPIFNIYFVILDHKSEEREYTMIRASLAEIDCLCHKRSDDNIDTKKISQSKQKKSVAKCNTIYGVNFLLGHG